MKMHLKPFAFIALLFFSTLLSAQIVTESLLWEAKKMDDVYLLKIKSNVEINSALQDFSNKMDITHAILQGSGDLQSVTLKNEITNKSKKIKTAIALTTLIGTLSLVDGIKHWDLKGVLNDKKIKSQSGLLVNAVVGERVELYVQPLHYKVHRTTNPITGIAAFDFTK